MATLTDLIIKDDRASRSWFHEATAEQPYVPTRIPASDTSISNNLLNFEHTVRTEPRDTHDYHPVSTDSSTTILEATNLETSIRSDSICVSCQRICEVPRSSSEAPVVDALTAANNDNTILAWYARWFRDWWALEVGVMFLGSVCIAIIAIMLSRVDGHEMPRWRLGITVDAILSLMSGACKSCLLMPTAEALGQLKWTFSKRARPDPLDMDRIDRASRGTWGSLLLLVRARGVTLASLGAAIILLSLPFDMCFQQIVRYPVCYVHDDTMQARLARTVRYDPPRARSFPGTGNETNFNTPPDDEIVAFSFNAWWTKAAPGPGVGFSCPTGNCTFLPFYTLGVDSQCRTLNQEILKFGCRNTSAGWHSNVVWDGPSLTENRTSCGHYLEFSGYQAQLMSGYEVLANGSIGDVLATRILPMTDIVTNEQFRNGSIEFMDTPSKITDFIISSTPHSFEGARRNVTPELTECEIHWVVKHIEATISSGYLEERVLKTITFKENSSQHWDAEATGNYLLTPSMMLADGPGNGTLEFGLSNVTARKVSQSLAMFIPSTFLQPANISTLRGTNVLKTTWINLDPHLQIMNRPILPIDHPNNASAHVKGIVTAIDEIVRRNALSEREVDEDAHGQVWRSEVQVEVLWAWFAFPAVLWSFAVSFLAATIWQSSKAKGSTPGTYKTSLLPMLLEPQKSIADGNMTARSMGSLREQARLQAYDTEARSHEVRKGSGIQPSA